MLYSTQERKLNSNELEQQIVFRSGRVRVAVTSGDYEKAFDSIDWGCATEFFGKGVVGILSLYLRERL